MANAVVIDALFCLPKRGAVTQISDCVPYTEDIVPRMIASGISGAVLVHGNCSQCQYQWNCAARRTQEIIDIVARNPALLHGLAAYDPLRIGESLRWIDDAVSTGRLAGAYAQAECCVSGLAAARMYPLYGLCARLRLPVVISFADHESWMHHRPQVEVVAVDFPELDIVLAPPPHTAAMSIVRMMQQTSCVSFLLCPQELQSARALCDYVELQGRSRVLFRASSSGWPQAVEAAGALALGPAAKRAYLSENAARLFSFPVLIESAIA